MKVEIYGTTWCTFCEQAKMLCDSNAIEYSYVDVSDSENLKALETRMEQKVQTVPQIFIDGNYIFGGFLGLQQELAKH